MESQRPNISSSLSCQRFHPQIMGADGEGTMLAGRTQGGPKSRCRIYPLKSVPSFCPKTRRKFREPISSRRYLPPSGADFTKPFLPGLHASAGSQRRRGYFTTALGALRCAYYSQQIPDRGSGTSREVLASDENDRGIFAIIHPDGTPNKTPLTIVPSPPFPGIGPISPAQSPEGRKATSNIRGSGFQSATTSPSMENRPALPSRMPNRCLSTTPQPLTRPPANYHHPNPMASPLLGRAITAIAGFQTFLSKVGPARPGGGPLFRIRRLPSNLLRYGSSNLENAKISG